MFFIFCQDAITGEELILVTGGNLGGFDDIAGQQNVVYSYIPSWFSEFMFEKALKYNTQEFKLFKRTLLDQLRPCKK